MKITLNQQVQFPGESQLLKARMPVQSGLNPYFTKRKPVNKHRNRKLGVNEHIFTRFVMEVNTLKIAKKKAGILNPELALNIYIGANILIIPSERKSNNANPKL